jgi:hypothetical protein
MKKYIIITLALLILPFGVLVAHAADLRVTANPASVDINQPVRVDVVFDTRDESVNAIAGSLHFPSNQFSLKQIDDGRSPFTFWIDPPAQTASGVVSFAGIVPGGFQGVASSVISIWLVPVASGLGVVTVNDVKVLKNDGEGTPVALTTSPASVLVSTVIATSSQIRSVSLIEPETFVPVVNSNPDVFDGKYFLAFSAVDKGSGIDHYEVLEVSSGNRPRLEDTWQAASSPYLIKDQSLSSRIFVRAVGHDGNFIVVEASGTHPSFLATHGVPFGSLGSIIIGIILLLLCVLLGIVLKRKSIL